MTEYKVSLLDIRDHKVVIDYQDRVLYLPQEEVKIIKSIPSFGTVEEVVIGIPDELAIRFKMA